VSVRRAIAIAAALAACAGCGSGTGLHVEDGGRTVPLHRVSRSVPPTPPGAHRPPRPGIELGGPAAIAYSSGTLWCAVHPGPGLVGSLVMVSTATGRRVGAPTPLPPAAKPYLLTAGTDGVWIASGPHLWRIDPTGQTAAATGSLLGTATAIVDAAGSIWVTVQTPKGGRLERIDPNGTTLASVVTGPAPSALTVADGSVWVADRAQQSIARFTVLKVHVPRASGHTIPLPQSPVRAPTQITVEGRFVWVYERGRVVRIDPAANAVVGTTSVAPAPGGTIAAGSGGVWVITRTLAGKGAVRLLDASTGLGAGRRTAVGTRPTAIATDDRGAWVLDSATYRLYRVFPP
jgi:streptogramin lyase